MQELVYDNSRDMADKLCESYPNFFSILVEVDEDRELWYLMYLGCQVVVDQDVVYVDEVGNVTVNFI